MLPGFSAESTVYATGATYRLRAMTRASGAYPAARLVSTRPTSGQRCDPYCLCVTPEGCPCCEVIAPQQPDIRESTILKR
jgi:hypothetical protein